ncbi:MAG: LysR family transcriptional regulator [Firmicutes bacterium]|nr:LysR family transcriptional regulator [Bacillota bacterium]
MDYNLLNYFNTVCEEGSIAAAAKKLYITTSALSQAIKQLESEIGYPLFDRVNNRLKLNDHGKAIKQHSEVIIKDFHDLETTIAGFSPMRLSIKICADDSSSLRYYLPIAIESFPNVLFSGSLVSQKDVKQMLLDKDCDIAFSSYDYHNDPRFYSLPFGDDRMFAYIPTVYPLSERQSISLADLNGYPILLTNPETTTTKVIQKSLKQKCPERDVTVIEDYGVYKQILATSQQYISFVSWIGTHFYNDSDFRKYVLLTDPEFRHTIYLIYLKENEEKLRGFLEWIRNSYKKLLV